MIDKIGTDSDYLTEGQVAQLLRAINPRRVGTYKKNESLSLSHVEAYELRAHLNRILGFARWSEEVTDQQLVFHSQEERPRDKRDPSKGTYMMHTVVYRSIVRLTICAPSGKPLATYTEGATGDNTGSTLADVHDNALKTSASQAFKRCCANLGDQFGLSLYRKGDKSALVKQTLLMPDVKAADEGIDDHVADSVPEDESFEPPPDPRTTNAQPAEPAQPAAEQPAEPAVDPAEREKQRKQDTAARIRQAALDPPPADWEGTGVRWISHLMGEAVQHKVQNAHVESLLSSTQVALRVMLEQRMKQLADEQRVAS